MQVVHSTRTPSKPLHVLSRYSPSGSRHIINMTSHHDAFASWCDVMLMWWHVDASDHQSGYPSWVMMAKCIIDLIKAPHGFCINSLHGLGTWIHDMMLHRCIESWCNHDASMHRFIMMRRHDVMQMGSKLAPYFEPLLSRYGECILGITRVRRLGISKCFQHLI